MAKDSVRFVRCLMRSHFFLLLAGDMRDSPPHHLCSLSWRHSPQITRALQAFVLLLAFLLQINADLHVAVSLRNFEGTDALLAATGNSPEYMYGTATQDWFALHNTFAKNLGACATELLSEGMRAINCGGSTPAWKCNDQSMCTWLLEAPAIVDALLLERPAEAAEKWRDKRLTKKWISHVPSSTTQLLPSDWFDEEGNVSEHEDWVVVWLSICLTI